MFLQETKEDMKTYDALMQPIKIGNVEIRNRVMTTAHLTNFGKDHNPSDQHVAYYGARAKGGTGLMVMGFPSVHPTSRNTGTDVDAFTDAVIPGLRALSDEVHKHGAKIFMQLGHSGRQQTGLWTRREIWAPSAIPCPLNGEMPKEMELEDIEEIIQGHADAAVRAKKGGMDGVEIHSGYGGYLLSSFQSPYMNRRDDEFGGSMENRMRFVLRVIDAVRAAVGADFVVGIQVQGHDYSPDGIDLPEAQAMARCYADTGKLDYMVVKASTYISGGMNIPDMQHPKKLWLPLADAIKEVVPELPIVAVGRINDADEAEQLIATGRVDLVAMTRQNIADPETANKLREGRGEDVRKCIACNQGCIDQVFKGQHVTCVHNPAAGFERELTDIRISDKPKRVVVVGGGPAGMKAAEIATRGGHDVTLFERRPQLGGQLRIAASLDGRSEIHEAVRWVARELDKLQVDVRLGQQATAEDVLALNPDVVIIATGSAPVKEIIGNKSFGIWETPGLDAPHVLNSWDVIEDNAQVGTSVLVVDDGEGGWKSAGLALELAGKGHSVKVSTPHTHIGARLGVFTQQKLTERILGSDIETLPYTTVRSVDGNSVQVVRGTKDVTLTGIDTVVLAGWHAPMTELYFQLKGKAARVERIGDALASRTMLEAFHEGERKARSI
jgi:mycofactocin system FadH/OYE family oxidoreductase 2